MDRDKINAKINEMIDWLLNNKPYEYYKDEIEGLSIKITILDRVKK